MNNTINTPSDTFIPSFTPNIGEAIIINWGAAGVYELISDTRWNEQGEYELLIHTWLGNNYGMTEDTFTAGRWWSFKDLSERYKETRDGFRKQWKEPKWSGVKIFNMAKVIILPPLGL